MEDIIEIVLWILAFVPAIVLHEMGHAIAAFKLGDPTAQRGGRISFNPLRHIDPFGTVILPILLAVTGLPVFGYAKPVPYNPRYFKDPRKGDLIVGLAGPGANLVQALAGTAIAVIYNLAVPQWGYAEPTYYIMLFLLMYIQVNLFLMFFNIIPVPPLDGSSIFAFILPRRYLASYYKIQQWALPVFMIIVIILPRVIGFNPFSWYLDVTAGNVFRLLLPLIGIAG